MHDVFGEILKDQLISEDPVFYQIERDDGLVEERNARVYFTDESEWSIMELEVLNQVVSPVLDLGCGGGRHSLYLQNQRHRVKSIDISQGAVEVCSQRGLVNCEVESIWDLSRRSVNMEKFKTLLLMGNNLGLSGSYGGLVSLLRIFETICEPEALLISDFFSPIPSKNEVHLKYHSRNRDLGKHIGEMRIRIDYKNIKSSWIDFYLPTHTEFIEIVNNSNWIFEIDLDTSKNHQFVTLSLSK